MTVSLNDRFGRFILSSNDGRLLGVEIAAALERGETVELDLRDVRSILASFLNPAIGDRYAEFSEATVDERIRIVNANDIQHETVEAVRAQARRYYNDPAYRDALDRSREEAFPI